MKTRNMILSGVFTLALIMLVTQVRASDFPQNATPGNLPPRIYLIDSAYDICANDDLACSGNGNVNCGGSRPDGFDLQHDGCIQLDNEYRFEEYAFTGEQLFWKVVVRDLNGAQDISYAKFTVAGYTEALCMEQGNPNDDTLADQIPAWETAGAGFQNLTDKLFKCVLTVEPQWYGSNSVNIAAYDQAGAVSTMSIAQSWFFNPAVILSLAANDGAPSITYEAGVPGQTVMSTNKLVVTNLAQGGVDLWAFIAADDLTDPTHSGALCPFSNVLDVEGIWVGNVHYNGMQYRCKIGTFEDDTWRQMLNKDNTQPCGSSVCYMAQRLVWSTTPMPFSIIGNLKSAECQFKLQYPVPCIGSFSQGNIHIIVKAV
jgi:hypothetical protein